LPPRWSGRAAGPALVGRRAELEVLEQAWEATLRGCRQALFVGGEPGAGKSRLALEVARTLHGEGAAVLLGSCLADLGGPYEPFVAPIEVLHAHLVTDPEALGVPPARAGVLLDRLAAVLGRSAPGRSSGAPAPAYARELYDAVVEVVVAAAGRLPVVLVLEDLHLAGPATVQLLAHLVQHSAGSRLLVLGTLRTTVADRSAQLVEAISTLYPLDGVRRLDLAGLDIEAVAEYLGAEGGVQARQGAVVLRDATGGNPFFLREVWRDLSARGGLAGLRTGAFRVPQTVLDTMQARLAGLAERQRLVVEVAAVLGDDVDVTTVSQAARATAEETLSALDAAVDLGFLAVPPVPEEPLHFVHHLARQAVLDLVPPSRLAHHHAAAVDVLELLPRDDVVVGRLAHHCSAARGLGLAERAVEYLVLAARTAETGLAHRESAALLARAAAHCVDLARRDELRLAAAQSLVLGADFARARAIFEDVAATGTPPQRLLAAVGYERAGWSTGAVGAPSAELLEDRLRLVPPDPTDPTWVRATASLARALAYTGDPEGDRLRESALVHARRSGDQELLADVLLAGMGHGLGPATAATSWRHAQELSALAERSGALDRLAPAAYNRAVLAYLLGDRAGMQSAAADLDRAARVTGQTWWVYAGAVIRFGRQVARGQLVEARRTAEELLELGRSMGMEDPEGPYGTHVFMVQREAGALEAVRGLISGQERPEDSWAPGLLGLYTELRLPGPTARQLAWVLDDSLGSQVEDRRRTARWPAVLALIAEAVLYLRDAEAAERLRPELARYQGLNLQLGAFDGPFGSADRYLGALDSLLGQGDPEALFDAALEMDVRMESLAHQAHGLALHVAHRRRAGLGGAATDELATRAGRLAEACGLRRVQRVLAASSPVRLGRKDGLTTRELEVLALLGEGCSNRAISTRLHISENTTAHHVRSILLKTGSGNRTQAAVYGREEVQRPTDGSTPIRYR